MQCLTVPSGVGEGGPFTLRPWQRRFIRDVYNPTDDNGDRRVRRAILSIGRKNGKTVLIAALALAHLVGPVSITNGEVYSAANSREQASQVFKMARQIVQADPELRSMLTVVPSTRTIANYRNGSVYRAISADAGIQYGLNPSMVIFDELAQARNRDLFDALDTAMGARQEPLFVTISTQSNDPEHILSRLIDDGLNAQDPTIVCHLYAVPDEADDIFDEKIWRLANPALGDFRSLEDLRALAARAGRMPSFEPAFRNLYLNQRVNPISSVIARKDWFACEGDSTIEEGERVYLALDMSSTTDLTALIMVSAEDGDRVRPWFWKPADLLRDHSDRDFGHGNHRYVEWVEAGHLNVSPGRSIDPQVIALHIAELAGKYKVVGLAYDRWRINDFLRELDRASIEAQDGEGSGLRLVSWGQGFRDMAPAIDALELAVLNGALKHPSNPVLNWNMANAIQVTDPAGNRKLDKDKARFRIDGAVALAMALGLKARDHVEADLDIFTMIA